MAKYSTGGIGGNASGACELCGAEDRSLKTETVAGAELEVCSECARHGDGDAKSDGQTEERDRRRKAAQNVARLDDARSVETDWEDGADYEDDPLPYLVRGYGTLVEQARQESGLQLEELAEAIGVDESELEAVEQGRAARASVGGSVIEALEARFDIELTEE